VPVGGNGDTNCDPDPIDYIIRRNDDAIRAIKLMSTKIADAVIEGQQMRGVVMAEAAASEVAAPATAVAVEEAPKPEATEMAPVPSDVPPENEEPYAELLRTRMCRQSRRTITSQAGTFRFCGWQKSTGKETQTNGCYG